MPNRALLIPAKCLSPLSGPDWDSRGRLLTLAPAAIQTRRSGSVNSSLQALETADKIARARPRPAPPLAPAPHPAPPLRLRQQLTPGFGDGGQDRPGPPLRRGSGVMRNNVPAPVLASAPSVEDDIPAPAGPCD